MSARPSRTAASAYRRFLLAGFDPVTAGNLTALAVGLTPAARGWRPREVEALLFLAWLDRAGRLPP
jgi:hypothetical protein